MTQSGQALNCSFDKLVGALLEKQWHVESERLRGLEVDDQFVLDRGLDRKLARLLARRMRSAYEAARSEIVDGSHFRKTRGHRVQ